ncbi:hypothetical protein RFI_23662 [Reticulomyxa filosa]|uniref:Uncharacterized protein n=1 Tax=Reticulomyxa filosa TaxID=46433 RepID=X6MJS3_RETFI|nr:hypothetical protein RFI_23662 [Reticulomyxa filosa]|eukprot:ETO13707.1 hypothetical protein RFI_23662 [Reticulomyxa filosa]
MFMKKRYCSLLQIMYGLSVLNTGLLSPVYYGSAVIPMPKNYAFFLEVVSSPIRDFSITAFLYALTLRYWMVCFDLNYALFQLNNQWKSGINKRYLEKDDVEKIWYYQNRSTFGNYSWMKRFTTVVCVVLGTLCSLLELVNQGQGRFLQTCFSHFNPYITGQSCLLFLSFISFRLAFKILYLSNVLSTTIQLYTLRIHKKKKYLFFVFILYIYTCKHTILCQCLKGKHKSAVMKIRMCVYVVYCVNYKIIEELSMALKAYSITIIVYFFSVTANYFLHDKQWDGSLKWFSHAFGSIVVCMVSELFLRRIIKESPLLLWDARLSTSRSKTIHESQLAATISANTKKNNPDRKRVVSITDHTDQISLLEILRHPKGYGVFMRHLIRKESQFFNTNRIFFFFFLKKKKKICICLYFVYSEISSENLLCYTELIQYQQLFKYCGEGCKKELEDIDLGEWDRKLVKCEENGSEIIPLSGIICDVLSVERQSQITSVTITQLYDIAQQLSIKYFEEKSPCQVNISEVDRNHVLLTFGFDGCRRDTLAATDVLFFYNLFRDSIREMFFLMNGAFARFIITNEYEQLLAE